MLIVRGLALTVMVPPPVVGESAWRLQSGSSRREGSKLTWVFTVQGMNGGRHQPLCEETRTEAERPASVNAMPDRVLPRDRLWGVITGLATMLTR